MFARSSVHLVAELVALYLASGVRQSDLCARLGCQTIEVVQLVVHAVLVGVQVSDGVRESRVFWPKN